MGEEELYWGLANAILERAVLDWRNLCAREEPYITATSDSRQMSFDALREFFNSNWCATLCGNVDPQYILGRLEKERVEALYKRRICISE